MRLILAVVLLKLTLVIGAVALLVHFAEPLARWVGGVAAAAVEGFQGTDAAK